MKTLVCVCAAAAGLGLVGCANQDWHVKRPAPEASTDISYHFNDEDAREIFRAMSDDMLTRPWLDRWIQEHGGKRPIIYLANVKNNTDEYISTNLFTNQIQDELINSGRADVKAEREHRAELRDERLDTQYNDPATVKRVAAELNADLALMGWIDQAKQTSNSGRAVVNYYQGHMELVDVETARKLWSDTKEIKKVATR